jgi:hypothetical protein
MSEHQALAAGYIAAWNQTDAVGRKRLIAGNFTDAVSYRDPVMQGDGHDGLDQLIAGVHQRFPGFRFTLKGEPQGFGDILRFSWTLGPDGVEAPIEGTDYVVVENGKMARVTGFLDKVPAQ